MLRYLGGESLTVHFLEKEHALTVITTMKSVYFYGYQSFGFDNAAPSDADS